MALDEGDPLGGMLAEGWDIAGYANTMLAAGAMTYSVLLRKGTEVKAVTSIIQGGVESGPAIVVQLAPRVPPKKKGLFG